MKQYFLFSGIDYYPAPGMGDFGGDFDTFEEARAAVPKGDDWAQILDTETGHWDWVDVEAEAAQ